MLSETIQGTTPYSKEGPSFKVNISRGTKAVNETAGDHPAPISGRHGESYLSMHLQMQEPAHNGTMTKIAHSNFHYLVSVAAIRLRYNQTSFLS